MPTRRLSDSLPKPKLIAVDLDGTLLDSRGRPHASDVRALKALAATGVPVTIVTGRLYSGTRPAAEALGIRGPVACVDGSHVVDASVHTTLMHRALRGDHATKLRDVLAKSSAATFLFARDAIVHDDNGHAFLSYVSTWSMDVRHTAKVTDHELWSHDDGVTAVVSVGEASQIQDAVDTIKRDLGAAAQIVSFPVRRAPGMWGMVTRAAGGSKGTALRWIAEHYGLAIEETVCVGDWMNDVPMFEVAGRAYAMGHAPDEAKSAATHVLSETAETGGGVARVVREAFGVDALPGDEPVR